MDLLSKLINPVICFLLTVAFGFWLSRRGKPYNGLLFNLHKLIALAAVILTAVLAYRMLKVMDVASLVIILLVTAALSVVALFLSGAFMSANVGEYGLMKRIHNISPFVLVLSMTGAAYLI